MAGRFSRLLVARLRRVRSGSSHHFSGPQGTRVRGVHHAGNGGRVARAPGTHAGFPHHHARVAGHTPEWALFVGAAVIVAYSCLGGQASVIRSDLPQCVLLLAGIAAALFWLFGHDSAPLEFMPLQLVNEDFGTDRFAYFMVIMGGSYLVCPMLFGRMLSAGSAKSAVRGAWIAVFMLLAAAAAVVALGVLCRGFVPADTRPDDVLAAAMRLMPTSVGMLLLVALLSAVLSSADSCIITASTVFCNDLLGSRNVRFCRLVTLVFGAGGLVLSTRGHGILDLLLMANDIYVCGVAVPVFAAMLMKKGSVGQGAAVLAVSVGGAGGLASAVSGEIAFGYLGMALAVAIMVFGVFFRQNRKNLCSAE